MDVNPELSPSFLSKRDDITQKLEIARKVACALDLTDKQKSGISEDRLFEIATGYEAKSHLMKESCTFKEYLETKTITPKNLPKIRQTLIDFYIEKRIPPKFEDIALMRDLSLDPPINKYFYSLAHHGFVWKNIPGTSKAIFVEKYEKIANRLRYLLKMKEYRKDKRHIIYLEDMSHRPNIKNKSFIAVSNRVGVINVHMLDGDKVNSYGSLESALRFNEASPGYANPVTDNQTKELLTSPPMRLTWSVRHVTPGQDSTAKKSKDHLKWITELLKTLPEPCVFVYEEYPQKLNDLLGPYSSKRDMVDLLNQNGIPFDRAAHRFDLYKLIERFVKPKLDEFSELIVAQGHEILLRPYGFDALDYFDLFWKSFPNIRTVETSLMINEDKIFNEDRMMEEIIDKVMTLGKYGGVVDDDLTEYSDVILYDDKYGAQTMFVD